MSAKESEFNNTATRLLTLLNVSATKKRKRVEDVFVPATKLNKRKVVTIAEPDSVTTVEVSETQTTSEPVQDTTAEQPEDNDEDLNSDIQDGYERHFGREPAAFNETSRNQVDRRAFKVATLTCGKLGNLSASIPECSTDTAEPKAIDILDRVKKPFISRQSKLSSDKTKFQNDLLSVLSTRRDLYLTSTPLDLKRSAREAISLHFLNHVTKKRRRVLKNNERLAHANKTNPDSVPPEEVQDQGFTRPSVLILLPFRSSALDWFNALTSHTPSPDFQIENQARFVSEYGIPPGTVDKLTSADPGTYPQDHVETFKGNVDDDFRVGIKITRKSVKMFAEFYGCDIIIASPLGLKRSIDKEKNADYLSSIEILVMDQIDALLMQNWDHTKTILSQLNQLPKESRDTDFSRIKPWYLDGHAPYLRQSILISPFETPETRSLFNTNLKNVEGKYRIEKRWSPVDIPEGIDQSFSFFNCSSPKDDPDKRFNHFTTVVLPSILKSAVQSTNTLVFIPSSFDFIRVNNYFKKEAGVTFDVLSEYSTNQDISRARQAFFTGKKSFLLVSERFHFFRRYKVRGVRNVVFYGPPDRPQFYTEMLSYPFLDDGVLPGDVTCKVIYSKYDWFRLERIAGTAGATELVNGQ